ncbi:MAG: PAS domain S-box protein [Desulfomonilia bacterium]|nr:PAS domain S-box protein [Desulfomonilia bacterium]
MKPRKDLTQELLAARASARESEERYRALFDRSFYGVFILDLQGNVLDANDVGLDMLGYGREHLQELNFWNILSEEQVAQAMVASEDLLRIGVQEKPLELRFKHRDGSLVLVETTSAVLYREGRPYAVQGIVRNISERTKAEESLRQSERFYRTIFENTGNASILIAEDTTILLANANFARLTGYRREEIEGKMSWTSFIEPKDLERMKHYHFLRRRSLSSAPGSYEFSFIARSGEHRDIFLTVALIPGTKESIASCLDITERKRAERELSIREGRFRSLIQNLSDIVMILDRDRLFIYETPSVERILQYSPGYLIGRSPMDFIHPDDIPLVETGLGEIYRMEGDEQPLEFRVKRSDNAWVYLEAIGTNLIHYPGIGGVVITARDITERKKTEEALHRSEERYRNILDNMQEAYYEVDLEGNFAYFNACAVTRLGYTDEEMRGMNFRRFVDQKNARSIFTTYHKVFLTGEPVGGFDWEAISKTGERIWVAASVSLMRDDQGAPAGFRGIVRDITERKKTEEALQRSEERYRNILDNMQEAYYEVDLKGTFTFFNLPAATRLGYTGEEMKNMNYQRFTDEESIRKLYEAYHGVYLTGRPVTGVEWEVINKYGEKIPVEASVSLKYDEAGNPAGFRGIVRDVTEQRKAQDALRRSEEKYRTILQSIQEGYLELDLSGNITFFNDSICKMLGYPPAEMQGMGYWIFTSADTAKRMYQVFHDIYLTGEPDLMLDYEVIRKDGVKRIHEMSASLMRDASGSPAGFRGVVRDMTERKRAQEALQRSEERWQFALEGAGDGVWDLNLKTGKVFRSLRWKEMLGYAEHEITDSVDEWTNHVHPDDRESSDRKLDRHLRGESPVYASEHRILCKDGSYKWILDRGKVIQWNHDGTPLRIIGTQADITERKWAEEALRHSEEQYRTIFEHTATANIIVDENYIIRLANSKFEKLAGYTKEELEGKIAWTSFVVEEDLDRMKAYHRQRRKKGGAAPDSYELRCIVGSGETRDLFMSVTMIPGTTESVASIIDMTDRKKAEEALRQSEERFRDMARLMPETVFEIDERGILTFANETAFDKFQYDPEDLDKGLPITAVVAPEDRTRATQGIGRVLAGERIGLNEYLARRKDGTTFPALVHAAPIMKNGRPMGARGFLIDISEKKILEEQFIRAQKMEAIGTMAGGIAHDFNNLLMGVLGNVSLMLLSTDKSHPFFDRLKNVEEYVRQGSELTKQFLGFARGGKYEVRPTQLGEFVRKSAEMFGRTKKEIRIHQSAQQELWIVEVDRNQMEQVMLNLFVNAWQAMPEGGDLYISIQNMELDESEAAPFGAGPGRYVRVSVTDTGIGMDEEVKLRIFEPFFTTKGKGRGGTGLGLASVYGIMRNHKGFITVESEKGAGSTFALYLPASDKPVLEERQVCAEIRKGQGTILLIDDEEVILDVGSEMLKRLGYAVITAAGGRAGIKAYCKHRDSIDLVVLDIIMPDLGGKDTFEGLKEIRPDVNVLLSSGYSLDGQAREIMDKGCRGFIQKPFSLGDLAEKIREILDGQ